jgi:predicted nucleic acid-binding protein
VNRSGVLLDTGPLVAFLSKRDAAHQRARELFGSCAPPFRTCEAVIAEACFLMRQVHADAPAEVLALGRQGVYELGLAIDAHWEALERLLKKYQHRPISLADACLVHCADIHDEPRILTFDADFTVYRWRRTRSFQILTL